MGTPNTPFERGRTLAGLDPNTGQAWLGRERYFEDIDQSNQYGAVTHRTNHPVCCKAFRNKTGGALAAKRIVALDPANLTDAIGYTDSVAQGPWAVVDEWLLQDVPDGDVFWGVIKGPTNCITEDDAVSISAGDVVVTSAGTDPSAADAGKVEAQDVSVTPTDQQVLDQGQNSIGRAMEDQSSSNADVLVYANSQAFA